MSLTKTKNRVGGGTDDPTCDRVACGRLVFLLGNNRKPETIQNHLFKSTRELLRELEGRKGTSEKQGNIL